MSSMHPNRDAWRHLRSDRKSVPNRVERGTVRRILRFARPHRRIISFFLAVTVVDAATVVVTPLLVQRIVDDGIIAGDRSLVTVLALAMAGMALVGAGLTVLAGWLSSRIGEGLIYDLRTEVFAHVQRQSLAFFTRTQTGALVSRLNNDVIGAQRAFTSTLSSTVSNVIAVVVVGGGHPRLRQKHGERRSVPTLYTVRLTSRKYIFCNSSTTSSPRWQRPPLGWY